MQKGLQFLEYNDVVKVAQDVFKHYTGIGQNPLIRVTITTSATAPAFAIISTDAMTWDECFADLFNGRSVARFICHGHDEPVQVQSPHMLIANDSILIEFD